MNGSDVGKMSPLGDRVLLKALEAKKETDGGVILATEESERPTLGKVRKKGEREKFRERERKKTKRKEKEE
jgi:co-chaperonin GroES (HSP10)